METTFEQMVAAAYGWPLWMVQLMADLARLEARAANDLFELALVKRANPNPLTWMLPHARGIQ